MGGYKNTEGYPDPTAGMAIHEVQKEERRKEHNEAVSTLITMLKQIISLAGFDLNSLVPELLNKVDEKGLGFMPAVELSYIKPKNQRLVAVSIDGEQSSPSVAQAKRLRELDKEGKLNGDVIDGILSEKKKEDKGVIISTAELEKYFGKEVTPAKMKEQIMGLLGEWKQKQPPQLTKAPKKMEKDK